MNELTNKKLQNLSVPAVSMKSHQVQLKQALLAASHPTHTTTKTRWSNLMTKPKFMVSGAAMAFAVLTIMAFSIFAIQGPASAEELTQQSLNKVSQLSPDELHALDLKVQGDPKAELEAAKKAKDLQILTYEQFQALQPHADTLSIHGPDAGSPGPESLNPASLKYLKYTDADGTVHTIGVDKDGLPVMIMTFRQNADGSSEGSVQVTGQGSGQMTTGGAVQAGPTPAGMTACSNQNGKVVCTNSDGSTAPSPNCQTLANGAMTCSSSATAQTTKP